MVAGTLHRARESQEAIGARPSRRPGSAPPLSAGAEAGRIDSDDGAAAVVNVFGAFTFGSLIKTFIPGFGWLIALLLIWRDLHSWVPALPPLPPVPTSSDQQNALVLAIPIAVLLGLLSNIIVFMGVNDGLVRRPVERANPQLFALYRLAVRRMRDQYWTSLDCTDAALRRSFDEHIDPEILMLPTVEVTRLAYVREQYWFHLEFQVNLLFATFVGLLALLASPEIAGAPRVEAAWRGGTAVVLLGGACWLLLRAARKNYCRHVAKMTSLITATLCRELRATAPDDATGGAPTAALPTGAPGA